MADVASHRWLQREAFLGKTIKKTGGKEVDLICMATAAKKALKVVGLFTQCTQFLSYGAIATESRLRFKLNSDLEIFLRSSWHVWS